MQEIECYKHLDRVAKLATERSIPDIMDVLMLLTECLNLLVELSIRRA